MKEKLTEKHLEKAFEHLNKAIMCLNLRFTGNKTTDMILETGYQNLDNLKSTLTELYKENFEND